MRQNLILTNYPFADNNKDDKFYDEVPMKETIKSIIELLEKNRYRNEQHVRFSLVARICYALNWNIWDPYVFDTEDQTDKFTPTDNGKTTKGKVDIVLYKTKKTDRTAHIFIEVKMVGELAKNLQKSREQLEQYSLKISPPLSVLTDGLRWEFFLNCLNTKKGKYTERLINSFELSDEDIDKKCSIISFLMNPSVSKTALEATGRKMKKEYEIIQLIQEVKQKAISLYPNDMLKQAIKAKELIKKYYNREVSLNKISDLWDESLALGGIEIKQDEPKFSPEVKTDPLPSYTGKPIIEIKQDEPKFSPGVKTKRLPSYTGQHIVEISIKKQKVIKISSCAELKKAVYDYIVSQKAGFQLKNNNVSSGIHKDSTKLRKPVQLVDGRFIEGNLSNDGAVKQCLKALQEAGFSKTDLIIGYK